MCQELIRDRANGDAYIPLCIVGDTNSRWKSCDDFKVSCSRFSHKMTYRCLVVNRTTAQTGKRRNTKKRIRQG